MMLIDSNIIIYATRPEYESLRQFIAEHIPSVSAISYVEVLGYHQLAEQERLLLETFFSSAPVLPLTQPILDRAVMLRQRRKMTLGDALIAGTALAHDLTLVTRNTSDFDWITELKLLDPLKRS
jgi:hypothetical protein